MNLNNIKKLLKSSKDIKSKYSSQIMSKGVSEDNIMNDKNKDIFLNDLYGFYCSHLFKNDINTYNYISDKEGGINYLKNLLETKPEKVWDYLTFKNKEGLFEANQLKVSMCKLYNNSDLFNYAQDNRIASFQFKNEIETYQKNIGLDNTKIKSFFNNTKNSQTLDYSKGGR